MLRWLSHLFGGSDDDPAQQPSPKAPRQAKKGEPTFRPVAETAAFHNTKNQLERRYKLSIDYATYCDWQTMIERNAADVLPLGRRENGTDLVLLRYRGIDIFLVCRDGLIMTALENVSGRYNHLVRARRLAREKSRQTLPADATLADLHRLVTERVAGRMQTIPPLIRLMRRRRRSPEN